MTGLTIGTVIHVRGMAPEIYGNKEKMHYCPVKFEKIKTYVILISNGFVNGGWIWQMQNIVFV